MTLSRASVRGLLLGVVICLVTAAPGRAMFEISGGSATVAPGGTTTVDFMITSDNPSGDGINNFNLELLITAAQGTTSFLQFTNSQPDFSTDPQYVLLNHSGAGASFWGAPFSTPPNDTSNDRISGGDFYPSDPPQQVTITPSSTYLLARVQVQADANASAGDTFHISLVKDSSQTYFFDAMNDPPYNTTNDATVTVEEANTVPAPPSLVLAGIAVFGAALSYWRRRKAARPAASV